MKAVLLLAALVACASPLAAAERCRDKTRSGKAGCPQPERKFEPYDPDRLKEGRRPGFIDMGGGTEVRVGGRARYEYGSQR